MEQRKENGAIVERYTEWLGKFLDSWQDLDWQRTLSLFADDVQYFEAPLDPPCNNFDELTELWSIVPENQKDIHYNYEILLCNAERCVANWQMSRIYIHEGEELKQQIDGIFLVELDAQGKCKYFKQWRYTRY